MVEVSVVIPVRDEEKNVAELVSRIKSAMEKIGTDFEVIFVTDLNKDGTLNALRTMNTNDNRIKTIKLSNSFGQHIAVIAGLAASKGRNVVIMDGDLQDYPEDIEKLYGKLLEGYDVVYGIKEKKNDSSIRNVFSKTFIKILNSLSDYKLDFNTCMFRILSRRAVDGILSFGETEPAITGLISIMNYPTSKITVTSGKRIAGETKYSFFRQVNIAVNFLLAFSTKPLRIASALGFIISMLSLVYLVIVAVQKIFFGVGVLGWPTIISLITFSTGLQLFFLGIIGEYIGKIFMETKNRPRYFIEEQIGNF